MHCAIPIELARPVEIAKISKSLFHGLFYIKSITENMALQDLAENIKVVLGMDSVDHAMFTKFVGIHSWLMYLEEAQHAWMACLQ